MFIFEEGHIYTIASNTHLNGESVTPKVKILKNVDKKLQGIYNTCSAGTLFTIPHEGGGDYK